VLIRNNEKTQEKVAYGVKFVRSFGADSMYVNTQILEW
jgi:hypothetical protein